jgi:cytidylate kinase
MIIKRKNILKIAIDSPAAAGAGTLAKAISKHYNLFYLDTGKIYRMVAYLKMKYPKKFNQNFIKAKIKSLKVKDLANKALLSDEVGTEASIISKVKSTRKLVHSFQLDFAYNPPNKYKGSCLDGRDITYNIVPDADFKFFITANLKTRAMRRFKELKTLNKKISYKVIKVTIIEKFHP